MDKNPIDYEALKDDPHVQAELDKILKLAALPPLKRGEFREGFLRDGHLQILVTKDAGKWHLSLSSDIELPRYSSVKWARYAFIPDNVYMAQIFPPKAEFINFHPYTLHLWQVSNTYFKSAKNEQKN